MTFWPSTDRRSVEGRSASTEVRWTIERKEQPTSPAGQVMPTRLSSTFGFKSRRRYSTGGPFEALQSTIAALALARRSGGTIPTRQVAGQQPPVR